MIRIVETRLTISSVCVCVFQVSELALEVAIVYYGGHLVITGQMSSGALISFFIYVLELGDCLEVFYLFFVLPIHFVYMKTKETHPLNQSPVFF